MCESSAHLAESIAGADADLGRVAGDRITGEHDPADLSRHHLLHHYRHAGVDVLPVLPSVLDRVRGEQRGPALGQARAELLPATTAEHSGVLTGRGQLLAVLTCGRRGVQEDDGGRGHCSGRGQLFAVLTCGRGGEFRRRTAAEDSSSSSSPAGGEEVRRRTAAGGQTQRVDTPDRPHR